MSRNVSMLSRRLGLKDGLFQQQQRAASEDTSQLARKALVGTAVIESSRSFYDFLNSQHQKRAYVCNGTACECHGKQSEVRVRLTKLVGSEQVGCMTCLGHCYQGGGFMLDGRTYDASQLSEADWSTLGSARPMATGLSLDEPVLLKPFTSIDDWYQPLLTAIKEHQTDHFLEKIIAANLRGRGGAGFPAGIKWQACREQQGAEKYIVCNADEGDPGAFSDRYLLEKHPHSVLFGMLLAAVICGAREGVLYLRAEYPQAIEICRQAIDELRRAGILAAPLDDQGITFDIQLICGSGAYICGEETALLRSIEGQRPVVSVRPPFPVESGLFGAPTVVNNVETFACCHWIVTHSGEQFASLGTDQSAGVKLICLDHSFNKPGLYEVPMGTTLRTVVDELGGGFRIPVKAIQVGGPLGGVVPVQSIDDLNVSFESFQAQGFLLGHGSIVGIPETMPMIDFLAHLFEFTAHESCGKCFPCRLGATRGHEMLSRAASGESLDMTLFNDLLETMELGSLCALGGGIPLPAKNIIEHFSHELGGDA